MNRLKFQKSLNALNGWRERAFVLSLSERAFPNAQLYLGNVEQEEDMQYEPLDKHYFDQVWQALILDPEEETIIELLDQALAHLPDLDNNEHYGALPTYDCLQILEQALVAGINDEKSRALDASKASLETITQFIEFSEGDGLSENKLIKLFDSHPLIEREFSFQAELSDALRAAPHPGSEFVRGIRTLAQDEGVSNIGISLA